MAQLLPLSTNFEKAEKIREGAEQVVLNDVDYELCPVWPPDLFAVVGTLIDRSGCYTDAGPDRTKKARAHEIYLAEIVAVAQSWDSPFSVPFQVQELWRTLILKHGGVSVNIIRQNVELTEILLKLFAIADEVSVGIGWGIPDAATKRQISSFAAIALLGVTAARTALPLPYLPYSFCALVPPDSAVVIPKSVTASVGCTIRSLSHNLALLPPSSVVQPRWTLSTKEKTKALNDMRLLLVPFPFRIHANSFKLSTAKAKLVSGANIPAYFKLDPDWLRHKRKAITGKRFVQELLKPLVETAERESGHRPDGIILPECALSEQVAEEIVKELAKLNIEFVITGVLTKDPKTKKWLNQAKTFVTVKNVQNQVIGVVAFEQNKHHRWRLDRAQTDRYALNFDDDKDNDKWWEDIDVSSRKLPFFALRDHISLVTLICEDLARADPAMSVIRAVGPNLVVALLMDGPQLINRWPGRYATVLAEDPGSAVLTVTCAAMVDRSNWLEAKPARSIALWREIDGRTQEIALPPSSLGVLLTVKSSERHQTTMDIRSDNSTANKLKLSNVVPLYLAEKPAWI